MIAFLHRIKWFFHFSLFFDFYLMNAYIIYKEMNSICLTTSYETQ